MAARPQNSSRRNFIKGAAAVSLFHIIPRHVLGGDGTPGANDRINHAIVGVGGMGMGHVGYCLNDKQAQLVAVCDVDKGHLDGALKKAGPNCKGYKDFREMLDRGDIDVCHVPTPPHWHALVSIAALNAGCDVWCEKPMTRTIAEGQKVIEAVKRNGRVFRLNTWFRLYGGFYGFGSEVKQIKKLVQSRLLGWPLTVRVSPFSGFDWKMDWSGKINSKPEPIPEGFDYDMWLGPAPYKPYTKHRTHGSFRGYWDYDGGGIGDMGQHYLDPVQYLLEKDNTSPVEVEAHAPFPAHPDAAGAWGWVKMRYADGCELIMDSGSWGEPISKGMPYIEGPKGKLYKGFKTDPPELAEKVKYLPDPEPQISDFNVSVRTRQKFGLNEENGHRSCTLINLANAAIRIGRKLQFDPVKQRFINDEEANRLVEQPMRAPWHL